MKLTSQMLRNMIKEEMEILNKANNINEGTQENPVQITTEYLNRIIREEYNAFEKRQRLAEARRRRRNR